MDVAMEVNVDVDVDVDLDRCGVSFGDGCGRGDECGDGCGHESDGSIAFYSIRLIRPSDSIRQHSTDPWRWMWRWMWTWMWTWL